MKRQDDKKRSAKEKSIEPEPNRLLHRPFRRIYFDTNVLLENGWPSLSSRLANVVSFSKGLGVTLHVPDVVYAELAACRRRDYTSEQQQAASKVRNLRARLSELNVDPSAVQEVPDVLTAALNGYRDIVEGLKQEFIACGLPTINMADLVSKAAGYELAFEENDKGFKDTLIFLSVVEDLKHASPAVSAVIVSKDGIFRQRREDLEVWALAEGASVLCSTFDEVQAALEHRQDAQMRARIEEDRKTAEAAVSLRLAEIQKWLDENLDALNLKVWSPLLFSLLEAYRVDVLKLLSVSPQYNPKRRSGERAKLSFDIQALLSVTNISRSAMRTLLSQRNPTPPGESPPLRGVAQRATAGRRPVRYPSPFEIPMFQPAPVGEKLDQVIEIEAEATYQNGTYTDFKYLTAIVKPEGVPLMPITLPAASPLG
jgi:hypothetical protein